MPIYEFECRKCKDHLEVFQKMSDKPPVKCKKCGGRLEKLVSASAIQFKGSGWYVTDYAGNGRKAADLPAIDGRGQRGGAVLMSGRRVAGAAFTYGDRHGSRPALQGVRDSGQV